MYILHAIRKMVDDEDEDDSGAIKNVIIYELIHDYLVI